MAIIHHGVNSLQEELDKYYEAEYQSYKSFFRENQKKYEEEMKAFRRSLPVKILLLLIPVAVIVFILLNPELIRPVQEWAYQLCVGWENALRDGMISEMSSTVHSSPGIWEALWNVFLSILSFIASILVRLLRVSSKVLVFLLCIGIPACVLFFSMKHVIPRSRETYEREHSDDEVRKLVMQMSLPNKMKKLQSGMEGEERALEMLSKLDDDCHIYTNLIIPYDGNKSETDIIVAAPHTVTIVEVKNYRDELCGDWSDEQLVLKAERGHTIHEDELYNPVKQVGTHVYRLANFLRVHGIPVNVKRCVLFVHSSVDLYSMTDTKNALAQCPVFKHYQTESLFEYVTDPQQDTSGERVVQVLNKLVEEQIKANSEKNKSGDCLNGKSESCEQ